MAGYTDDTSINGMPFSPVFSVMRDRRHRLILSVLFGHTRPLEITDLATHIVSWESDEPLISVKPTEHAKVLVDLRESQIPTLEETGLIKTIDSRDAVTIADRNQILNLGIADILQCRRMSERAVWDNVFRSLSSRRTRQILGILTGMSSPVDIDSLVERVLAHEFEASADDISPEEKSKLEEHIRSSHLPLLKQVGLVEYTADRNEVRATENPDINTRWLETTLGETIHSILSTDFEIDTNNDVGEWRISNLTNPRPRGLELVSNSTEEVVLMFTTTDIVEEKCLEELRSATSRCVDVYIVSQSQDVLDYFMEHVPGITPWKLDVNWLEFPPYQETSGQLVFSDQSSVMVMAHNEDDTSTDEIHGVLAEGKSNPLVTVLMDLLCSRVGYSCDYRNGKQASSIPS